MYLNYSGDRRNYSKVQVNEDTYIQEHNERTYHSFSLKQNDFFDGQTMKEALKLFSINVTTSKIQPECDKLSEDVEVPANYNFYTESPDCSQRTT